MNRITKPWYVFLRQIVSTADGAIYGLGSDQRVYCWHHSLEYRGKWVIHYNVTEQEAEISKTTDKLSDILKE